MLSSVGEIAKLKPDVIKKMIKDNGDGTYTVTQHQQDDGIGNAWGLFSHDYKEVQVKVTADVPAASVNRGAGQSEQDGKKEIWPLLLEKAYAGQRWIRQDRQGRRSGTSADSHRPRCRYQSVSASA